MLKRFFKACRRFFNGEFKSELAGASVLCAEHAPNDDGAVSIDQEVVLAQARARRDQERMLAGLS
jgi:hypothetical protein